MSANEIQRESTSSMTRDNDDSKDPLTTLPDVPLLLIVTDLSLQESFSIIDVHPRFQLICGSLFASKQRLVLYIGNLDDVERNLFSLSASALEHLTLEIEGALFGSEDKPLPVNLSLLGRLKEFFWVTKESRHLAFILDVLRRPGCEQLTSLGTALYGWEAYQVALSDHPLADRFKILFAGFEPPGLVLTQTMVNLPMFTVSWQPKESLNLVTQRLSGLTQLRCLTLFISKPPVYNFNQHPVYPLQVHALPSVTVLRIFRINRSYTHDAFEHCNLEAFFPSVQIVHFVHMNQFCAICFDEKWDYSEHVSGFEEAEERWSCRHQLLYPFTKLPSLRQIFYQRNLDSKHIAEFNARLRFVKTHAYID